MSLLDDLLGLLSSLPRGSWARAQNEPAWRQFRWSGQPRLRKPRIREEVKDNYDREEYADKDTRDLRFSEMRARNRKTVKYSTVRANHAVWVVAWPRS